MRQFARMATAFGGPPAPTSALLQQQLRGAAFQRKRNREDTEKVACSWSSEFQQVSVDQVKDLVASNYSDPELQLRLPIVFKHLKKWSPTLASSLKTLKKFSSFCQCDTDEEAKAYLDVICGLVSELSDVATAQRKKQLLTEVLEAKVPQYVSLNDHLSKRSEALNWGFGEVRVISSSDSVETLKRRHVRMETVVPQNQSITGVGRDDDESLSGGEDESKTSDDYPPISVFVGESGSGKTVAALRSGESPDYVVYLVPGEGADIYWAADYPPPPKGTRNDDYIDGRNNAVKEKLVATLKRHLSPPPGGKLLDPNARSDVRLHIVVDEMGGHREHLRGLCAVYAEIAQQIKEDFNLTHLPTFAAAGTGCVSNVDEIGSEGSRFQVCHVALTFGKLLTAGKDSQDAPLLGAIERTQTVAAQRARWLCTNGRSGAALLRALRSLCRQAIASNVQACVQQCLPAAVLKAAFVYQARNGLSSLSDAERMSLIRRALTITLGNKTDDLSPNDLRLVSKYGVLFDRMFKKVATEVSVENEEEEADAASKKQERRYTISPAQAVMFLSNYGVNPCPTDVTGEGFEAVISDYHSLRLICNSGVVAGAPPAAKGISVVHRLTLSPAAQLSPTTGENRILTLEELCDPNNGKKGFDHATQACVILNAPKAPYADLVVVVPSAEKEGKSELWLVQVKRYLSTPFTVQNSLEELAKMGHPGVGESKKDGKPAKEDGQSDEPKKVQTKAQKYTEALKVKWNATNVKYLFFIGHGENLVCDIEEVRKTLKKNHRKDVRLSTVQLSGSCSELYPLEAPLTRKSRLASEYLRLDLGETQTEETH